MDSYIHVIHTLTSILLIVNPPHESRGLKSTPRHRLWTVLRGFFVDRFAAGTIPGISREQKSWRAGSDAVAVE